MPNRPSRPWVLIPLAAVAAAGAGVLMALSLLPLTRPPGQGSAFTLLLVQRNPPAILGNPQQPAFDNDEWDSYRGAQVALVKSEFVIKAALREPKVAQLPGVKGRADPVGWLQRRLSADFEVAPGILRISVLGANEQDSLMLVTAVREAYVKEVAEKEHFQRFQRLDQLKRLYDKYDTILQGQRRKLRDMRLALGDGARELLLRLASKRLDAVQQELLQVQSQLRKGRIELGALKGPANGRPGTAEPGAVEELRQRLQVLQELEQVLGKEVEAQTREVQQLPNGAVDLQWLRAEITQAEELARRIGREKQALEVEIDAPHRVRLLQEATILR